ncbi:MAG: hypothetical protein KDK30_03085 [Leptospiraceae bacterium]|nr:hypothetical protein [Leptospiraceae bacterium]
MRFKSKWKSIVMTVCMLPAVFGSSHCTTIDGAYYLRAANAEMDESENICPHPCAHIEEAGFHLYFWSKSSSHPVMRGACLIPFWPMDTAYMDGLDIRLYWRIIPPTSADASRPTVFRIQSDSFVAYDSQNQSERPLGLSIDSLKPDGSEYYKYFSFAPYADEWQTEYEFAGDTELQLWYINLIYSQLDELRLRIDIQSEGRDIPITGLVLETDMRYEYTALEIPLTFAPVR